MRANQKYHPKLRRNFSKNKTFICVDTDESFIIEQLSLIHCTINAKSPYLECPLLYW